MQRLSARATWYVYEAAASFLGVLAFTVTAVYYVTEVGMSPLQLVLVGTFMEVSIFVFEVPTGVVADTYSRRLSIVIGTAVMGVAVILFGAFAAPWPIIAAAALWGFGYTFTSGAFDAWLADEVGPQRLAGVYLRGAQVGRVASLAGIGASVGLAIIDLRLPIIVAGAGGIVLAAFFALTMPETSVRAAAAGGAWVVCTDASHGCARRAPRAGAAGAPGDPWHRRVRRDVERGLRPPLAGAFHPRRRAAVARWARSRRLVRRLRRRHDPSLDRRRPSARQAARALVAATVATTLFWLDASLLVSALVFGLAGLFWVALVAYFAVGLARNVAAPIFQTWLNRNVEESGVRATVLSITSQADAVGQWTGGPAIGLIGNVFSIRAALVAGSLCMAPALALYRRAARHGGEDTALEDLPVLES